MGIEDIQISEELQTNAPSIKYSGNEGPKSPQQMQEMMMAQLEEEYLKYVDDMMEQGMEPMTLEQFLDQVMAEGQMSGGQPLPQDPTKPVNPFQPKPTGPVLPDRQMAAYGGIMGVDGRKKYGIGSWFQKAKDKVVDDLIPNEIKENPLLTAAAVAAGDYYLNDRSYLDGIFKGTKDFVLGGETTKKVGVDGDEITTKNPNILKRILGSSTGEDRTVGSDILGSISKNIVPIVGGIGAGLFTKNTASDTPGLPDDTTGINLADYKKAANLLNQKQGLAANMNFLPTVASRKYSPEEMAITYANAANGGRIGFNMGGGADYMPSNQAMNSLMSNKEMMTALIEQMQNEGLPQEMIIQKLTEMNQNQPIMAMGGRINRAEGGIMDLGGMEKDYRAEGGFVPIGKAEKADDVPARLSVNEFVFTADAVRNAGGGDIDKGAQVMENMMRHLEQGGQVSEESQGMAGARDMFATSQRLSEVI
jgi:hypothetical protein